MWIRGLVSARRERVLLWLGETKGIFLDHRRLAASQVADFLTFLILFYNAQVLRLADFLVGAEMERDERSEAQSDKARTSAYSGRGSLDESIILERSDSYQRAVGRPNISKCALHLQVGGLLGWSRGRTQ